MLHHYDPRQLPKDPETPALTRLLLKRWMQLSTTLPRAGIITVFGPSGYDKTRFARILLTEHWVTNFSTAYVSVSALERTPMALIWAIVAALQLPATTELSMLMGRFAGQSSVAPSIISATREQLQNPALDQHLLILDDLDTMTEEMRAALSNILLRTMGKVALRIVLCGRNTKLGLRNAGVPLTMITEEQLTLSDAELTEMGITNPELRGWPLAVRLALTAMSEAVPGTTAEEPVHTLVERLLERVDTRLLSSLEAASIAPDWPLSVPVMRALGVDPDFVTLGLKVGLPILVQPNERFQPHPLLQQELQRRLLADPPRLAALSAAYASSTDVDTGRQLETLLSLPSTLAVARLAGILRDVQADDIGDWVAAHSETLWKLYTAQLLTRETDVAVQLARARGESGKMQDAFNLLKNPAVRPAGLGVIEQTRAHLFDLQGRYVQALECQKRALRELELLPVTPENAIVYARTALTEALMAAAGYQEATLSSAEHNARAALRCAGPEMKLVRTMSYSVIARLQALRGNGSSMDGTSVAELTTTRLVSQDALKTTQLIVDGLLECGDTHGATPLLALIERDSPSGSAVRRVNLPLMRAQQALLEGNLALAIQFAGVAWSALAEDHRNDQALVLYAGELRMLAELLVRQTMNVQERKVVTAQHQNRRSQIINPPYRHNTF